MHKILFEFPKFLPKHRLTTMAYTSVNYSLNHLFRLLSSRDQTFSKVSQIPMLKLELVFLRTFLWWTAKQCREKENLEYLLLQIEVVVRNAVNHIESILLNGVEDIAKDLDAQVLHHIRLLKPEIETAYIEVAKCSRPVPDTLVVVELMNNLIDNLKDLLRYPDFSAKEELTQLAIKLRFLRNLLSFVATRCSDHEKLKDLSSLAEAIAIEAACLPFMFSLDQKNENSTSSIKDKLTELTRKIKPVDPDITRIYVGVLEALSPLTTEADTSDPDLASFIDTLQDCLAELQDNQPPWIDSLKVNFKALHHELTFLSSFVKDPPNQFIESDKWDDLKVDPIQLLLGEMRDSDAHPFEHYTQHLTLKGQFTRIQDLAVKVGCTIFFFFNFNEMEEHKLAEAETTLVDLIEKIKHLKSDIRVDPIPEFTIVRVDDLGFISNLRELLDRQAGPVNCLGRRVQGIADELEFLSSFLRKYGERRHEHEKLRNLAAQIMTVAYRAEYVIDSLLVRDGTVFYHSLRFVDVTGEMKRIRREVMMFDEKMSYVIAPPPKVLNSTMPSRDLVNDAVPEELVGLEKDMYRLMNKLIFGSRELTVIPILGISGLGKTTLAMSLFYHKDVVNLFDIRAAVSVSQIYDAEELVLAMWHKIIGYPGISDGGDVNFWANKLYKSLKGRKFFILIDDLMGDIAAWDYLRILFPDDNNGSRILLTTRSYEIASYAAPTGIHNLRFLTQEESWELLKKKIFLQQFCPPELEGAGKRIAKQCHGIPAMLVWIAGILARKRTETDWIQVAQSNQIDEYLLIRGEQEYSDIPDHLRQCLLYFGAFPLEEEIPVSKLIRLWAAEGFIQQTEAKSFEDVAMDYLMNLIGQGLVMVCQRSSEGVVKRCKVHDRLQKFCLAKANHENFFQLMEGYGDVSTPLGGGIDPNVSNIPLSLTCEHRRLFISSYLWDNISLKVAGPLVRSLVLTGSRSDIPRSHASSLYKNFKLVRVLDLGRINVGNDFPVGLENMTLLKYLEVRGEMTSIPSSIGNLRQLETFVTIGLTGGEVSIPDSIWSLTNLRHLHINNLSSFGAHDYKQAEMLPNLISMSTPLLIYGEDSEVILRRLPRLEKLKCIYLESWDSIRKKNLFPKLGILEHVQSLKLFYDGEVRKRCQFHFPSILSRLTLSHFRLPWDQISIIGQLPNLSVLKLLNNAFEGSLWEVEDDQFFCLKLLKLDNLDLKRWEVSDDAFPKLELLELQKCKKLKEMPFSFADSLTLIEIQLECCSQSLEDSAGRIQQERQDIGDDLFRVIIIHQQ